ncbi:MAG: CoA ester lyase [Betaproteobacteria bacterium]
MRHIRTALYAPGINTKVMQKAMTTAVDAVIFDLEDSVPIASKGQARELVRQAITELHHSTAEVKPYVMVRTNSADTGLLEDDIRAMCVEGLGMLFIPKAEQISDISQASQLIEQLEKDRKLSDIAIGLQIETALGVYNCYPLIKASPRVQLTSIGTAKDGDLQNDLACGWSVDGIEMLYARSKVLLDSRAAGNVTPIDGVFANLNDDAGLLVESTLSAKLGYVGRTIIHPKQIQAVEQAYGIPQSTLDYYANLIEEFEKAEKQGIAAIKVNDQLVDYAMYRQAKRIISIYQK